jgi:hypothetical protein
MLFTTFEDNDGFAMFAMSPGGLGGRDQAIPKREEDDGAVPEPDEDTEDK